MASDEPDVALLTFDQGSMDLHEHLPRQVIGDKDCYGEIAAEARVVCGHQDQDVTYAALESRYHWLRSYNNAARHVRSDDACQYQSEVRPVKPLSLTLSPSVFRCFVFDTFRMPDDPFIHTAPLVERVATSRTTGYTPYSFAYRWHAPFPLVVSDYTWHILARDMAHMTEDFPALQTNQRF